MRFAGRMGVAVLVGIVARTLYVLVVMRHVLPGFDATWYYLQAGVIRDEHAYADPSAFLVDRAPTAAFPPLYPAFLALVQTLFGDSVRASQLGGLATGTATIVLTGLLGRRVAGEAVGVVAAVLAALSPMLIAVDGSMMAETLFIPLALGTALAAMYARTTGRWWCWALAGALAGLATLTRVDGLLLAICVVAPTALLGATSWKERLRRLTLAGVALAIVVMPWVARNQARLDTPMVATVSSATALAGSNCEQAYGGASLGSWEFACIRPDLRASLDETAWTSRVRRDALAYARDHPARLPVVAAARVARLWGLWTPSDLVDRDAEESRHRNWQWLVTLTGPIVVVAGGMGLWTLARRGRPVAPLVGLLATSSAVALLAYGNPRFRAVSEPALLVGIAALLRRYPAEQTRRFRWASRSRSSTT